MPNERVFATSALPRLITRQRSGLVVSDSLDSERQTKDQLLASQSYWTYGGSADTFDPPVPRDLFKGTRGLHIGVQAPADGTYAGYFAMTRPTRARLFHAAITAPARTIAGNVFQTGLYVQTADGRINYATCVAATSATCTTWRIVRASGNCDQATEFEELWEDGTPHQPLTRDCTIITNGSNHLLVYLDGRKVYESDALDLRMPEPFLCFLEPQSSHATMLHGVFRDFYIALDDRLHVINTPPTAARTDITDSSGQILASAPVVSGTASLDIGPFHFPLAARITVYDAAGGAIARTNDVALVGGDVYSVEPKLTVA